MAREVRHKASMAKLKLIGDRIRAARKAQGLTQESAAAWVGISLMTVRRHEQGIRKPSQEHIAHYSLAYGVSVADLLAGMADEKEMSAVKDMRRDLLDLDTGPTYDLSLAQQELLRRFGQLSRADQEALAAIVEFHAATGGPLREQAAPVASIMRHFLNTKQHQPATPGGEP